ncbi:hypothetical protein GW17_00012882, partial [Ensete ventricosum]
GTAKIGRRRSIKGEIDRRRSIEEEKGKRKKKKKKKAEEEEKNKYLTRAPSSPAGDFSPCVGREIEATSPATGRYRRLGLFPPRYHLKSTVSGRFRAVAAEGGRKKREKKREEEKNLEFVDLSPAALGSDFFSPCGVKERCDVRRTAAYRLYQATIFRSQGEAIILEILKGYQAFTQISKYMAVGLMQGFPYRSVPSVLGGTYRSVRLSVRGSPATVLGGTAKIDRQRSIGGEIDSWRSIEGEKGKKKKKKRKIRKKKEYLTPSSPVCCRRLQVARESSRPSLAIFLPCGEKDRVDVLETLASLDRTIHSPHASTQGLSPYGIKLLLIFLRSF